MNWDQVEELNKLFCEHARVKQTLETLRQIPSGNGYIVETDDSSVWAEVSEIDIVDVVRNKLVTLEGEIKRLGGTLPD